jgi:hypothetical protein
MATGNGRKYSIYVPLKDKENIEWLDSFGDSNERSRAVRYYLKLGRGIKQEALPWDSTSLPAMPQIKLSVPSVVEPTPTEQQATEGFLSRL